MTCHAAVSYWLTLLDVLQGQPRVESIPAVYTVRDQNVSDHEENHESFPGSMAGT